MCIGGIKAVKEEYMKKFLSLMLVLCMMMALLVSCGGDGKTNESESTPSTEEGSQTSSDNVSEPASENNTEPNGSQESEGTNETESPSESESPSELTV